MVQEKIKKFHLEKALAEIEKLVEKMESEQLDLEKSLHLFEHGIGLIKDCHKSLAEAEQRVQQLTKNQNQFELAEFHKDE
jgi:exodeoxyribonuclease VII small subunit